MNYKGVKRLLIPNEAAHRNGIIPPGVWNGCEHICWPV